MLSTEIVMVQVLRGMARERVSEYRALIDAEVRHREERAEEAP